MTLARDMDMMVLRGRIILDIPVWTYSSGSGSHIPSGMVEYTYDGKSYETTYNVNDDRGQGFHWEAVSVRIYRELSVDSDDCKESVVQRIAAEEWDKLWEERNGHPSDF